MRQLTYQMLVSSLAITFAVRVNNVRDIPFYVLSHSCINKIQGGRCVHVHIYIEIYIGMHGSSAIGMVNTHSRNKPMTSEP